VKAKFLKSAVFPQDYPAPDRPEVALVGRSNAGKSSLLNALAGGSVAKVSQEPGKTRLLNFFDYGKKYRFVDMPGYGYASRSGSEILGWQEMITKYCEVRENLTGVVLIMDCVREWQEEEDWLLNWCIRLDVPMMVVLNKADKLKKNEQTKKLGEMQRRLGKLPVHLVSAIKKSGVEELEEDIYEQFVRGSE
jgi:GTP-binding protein